MTKEINIENSQTFLNDKKLKQNPYRISFVKQNQQQEVIQKNQEELYQYFANNTGTMNYEEQKQEINDQYEKALNNLDKAQKLLEEYQTSVEEQNQYAEKYQQYSKAKDLLQQVNYCLDQLSNQESNDQINQITQQKLQINQQIKENATILKKKEDTKIDYQLEIQELQKQQQDQQVKLDVLDNYEKQLQQYDNQIINQMSQQKQFNNKSESDNQQQKIIKLQTQIQNKQKMINQFEFIQSLDNGKAKVSLNEMQQQIQLKIKDLTLQQQQNEDQMKKIQSQKDSYLHMIKTLDQSSLMSMRSKVQQQQFKEDQLQRQLYTVQNQQNQIIMQIFQGNQQKYQIYQFLQQFKNKGLLGLFGELINVSPELTAVIETACQGLLQNYVIDTQENAIKIISQLQLYSQQNQQLQGCRINFITCEEFENENEINKRLSFATQISSQESKENIAIMAEQIQPLNDKIRGIIYHFFGRTLIVQTFIVAKQFSKQFKCDCFTVDGDSIRHSGIINAGYHSGGQLQLLIQSGQLLIKIENISQEVKKCQQQLKKLESQLNNIQKEFYEIQNKNSEIQQLVDQQLKQQQEYQEKIVKINATLLDLNNQQDLIKQLKQNGKQFQLSELQSELNDLQTQLTLAQQAYQLDQQNNNMDQQSQYMLYLLIKEIKQTYNINDNIVNSIQNMQQSQQQIIQKIQQQMQYQSSQIDLLDAEIKQLQQDQEVNQKKITELQDQEQILKEQIEYINNKEKGQTIAEHILSAMDNKSGLLLLKQKYAKELQDLENQVNILQFQTYQSNVQLLAQQQEEFNKYNTEKDKIKQKLQQLDQIRLEETQKNFDQFIKEFNNIFNYFQTGFQIQVQLQNNKIQFQPSTQSLSGGQQTIVALTYLLAQNLIANNLIMLLDELDSNLDQSFREKFYQLLKQLIEQRHMQIVMTSFKRQSVSIANKVLLVQNGEIQEIQDVNQISDNILAN